MKSLSELIEKETLGVVIGARRPGYIHVIRDYRRLCGRNDNDVFFLRPPSVPTEVTMGYMCEKCMHKLRKEEDEG